MKPEQPSTAEVRAFVLEYLSDQLGTAGVDPDTVSDSFDLLAEGVIDSFGVLDLMSAVGDRYGIDDEWEGYAAEDILVLGAFCTYVARSAGARR